MKIGILFLGVLLIIGAVSEYCITPIILDKVNNITNNLENNMITSVPNSPQNYAYASIMTDANAEASQLTSDMTMLETQVTNYTSWSATLIGIGLVSYGMLGKSNQKTKNSHALDILKTRLAKGEITKNQFDQLKNDVV